MNTIIKILVLIWPVIKQGVLGKYKVKSYLSRRKFTTFLIVALFFCFLEFLYMTEQATNQRARLVVLTQKYNDVKNKHTIVTEQHRKAKLRNLAYEKEILRLYQLSNIPSPYIDTSVKIAPTQD